MISLIDKVWLNKIVREIFLEIPPPIDSLNSRSMLDLNERKRVGLYVEPLKLQAAILLRILIHRVLVKAWYLEIHRPLVPAAVSWPISEFGNTL